jgi:hypothetical protein
VELECKDWGVEWPAVPPFFLFPPVAGMCGSKCAYHQGTFHVIRLSLLIAGFMDGSTSVSRYTVMPGWFLKLGPVELKSRGPWNLNAELGV